MVAFLDSKWPRQVGAEQALLHAVEIGGGAALEDVSAGGHK